MFNSWGSGANPWGPEKEDQFSKPNHWDGMLEVVGVTGVVHLGQIQSGLRSAMRIAQVSSLGRSLGLYRHLMRNLLRQGGHIKIHLHTDIPVQVDGEPWVQSPGDVVVLKSALKVSRDLRASSITFPKFVSLLLGDRFACVAYVTT